MPRFLIWSNEHRAWWRPNSQGYTADIGMAGVYTEDSMREICAGATLHWDQAPNELPVRAEDLPDDARIALGVE